jgi:hypothetical protein
MDAPISSPIQRPPVVTASTMSSIASSTTRQSPSKQMAVPTPRPTDSTDSFLRDFTLVAEAAKRAQVAIMCRDFEGCGL